MERAWQKFLGMFDDQFSSFRFSLDVAIMSKY